MENKNENWNKRKAKATFAATPNKVQLKNRYSKSVGTTVDIIKQFYREKISLRDMQKDYPVATINQENKETACLYTSSNIVTQTCEDITNSKLYDKLLIQDL